MIERKFYNYLKNHFQ